MRIVPNHPPTCFLCAGTGYVCVNHPERPYWSTRLAAACNACQEAHEALLMHGAKVVLRYGCDRCLASYGQWCRNSDGTIRNHLHVSRVREAIAKRVTP